MQIVQIMTEAIMKYALARLSASAPIKRLSHCPSKCRDCRAPLQNHAII